MDLRHLTPKDRNDRVKLKRVREYAAAQARYAAETKEAILREKCKPFLERGYRVEDIEMIEQRDPIVHPILGRINVQLSLQGKLVWPWVLTLRRAWRKVVPYRVSLKAERSQSRVEPGIE